MLLSISVYTSIIFQFWKKFKRLPVFEHSTSNFDSSLMKAPKDQHKHFNELPFWCKVKC